MKKELIEPFVDEYLGNASSDKTRLSDAIEVFINYCERWQKENFYKPENKAIIEVQVPLKPEGVGYSAQDLHYLPRILCEGKLILMRNFEIRGGMDDQVLILEVSPHSFAIRFIEPVEAKEKAEPKGE